MSKKQCKNIVQHYLLCAHNAAQNWAKPKHNADYYLDLAAAWMVMWSEAAY